MARPQGGCMPIEKQNLLNDRMLKQKKPLHQDETVFLYRKIYF